MDDKNQNHDLEKNENVNQDSTSHAESTDTTEHIPTSPFASHPDNHETSPSSEQSNQPIYNTPSGPNSNDPQANSQPTGIPNQSTPPTTPPNNLQSNDTKHDHKNFVTIIVLILLITIGIVVYIITNSRGNQDTQPVVNTVPTIEQPTATPTSSLSPEEQEIEAVDLENPAPTDLVPVEEDLSEL